MTSLYETNILNQTAEWKRLLTRPLPSGLNSLRPKKIVFVGIGSSYWVARFAEFLWREYTKRPQEMGIDTISSVQSYDFVRSKYLISTDDVIVVVFSHRGTKTFSMQALEDAKRAGATTVLVTGIGSPKQPAADYRIETCTQENCGAFTISLTCAIVRIIQWLGLLIETELIERFKEAIEIINLPFKEVQLPKFPTNLIIVGDLIREVVAREVALKISETSYLPVRSFGLEEFLHGARVTLDKQTSLLAFTSITEPRSKSLIKYVQVIGSEVINVDERLFSSNLPIEFVWLSQLIWGQQLALELAKKLNTNPDTVRGEQSPYSEARKLLVL
jgi:glutamine---fructose-6-phosphate transaminase (isomerizing)